MRCDAFFFSAVSTLLCFAALYFRLLFSPLSRLPCSVMSQVATKTLTHDRLPPNEQEDKEKELLMEKLNLLGRTEEAFTEFSRTLG